MVDTRDEPDSGLTDEEYQTYIAEINQRFMDSVSADLSAEPRPQGATSGSK